MAKHNVKTDHFSSKKAAEYYAKGRPYVHDEVIQRVCAYLHLKKAVPRALDIGCGTGLSAVALKEISRNVVALDISYDMVAAAPRDQHINCINAVAEYLPLTTTSFDLVTVSSAFHWFDKVLFTKELNRVLKSRGWAIIYENHLTPQQEECPEFKQWYYDIFKKRYPKPPRDYTIDFEYFKNLGINFLNEESFKKDVYFTSKQLIYHLLSLTHVISVVANGGKTYNDVTKWLHTEIKQFPVMCSEANSSRKVKFRFAGTIQYFQKQD